MTQKNVEAVLKQWNQMKNEIEQLSQVGQASLKEIQAKIDAFIKNAEKDLTDLVEKDLANLMKTFQKEKKSLEGLVEKRVNEEIKKAKAFLQGHKKELDKIQKLVETYVPALKKKSATKKTTKKKTATKKTTKKAAAKTATKKASKKTAKKVAKKAAKKTSKKAVSTKKKVATKKAPAKKATKKKAKSRK